MGMAAMLFKDAVPPPSGAGIVFVNDTFTDTSGTALNSHTGEVGATWNFQNGSGTAVISSEGRLRAPDTLSTGDSFWAASGVPITDEYDVEAVFHVLSPSRSGIAGRMGSGYSGYWVEYNTNISAWVLSVYVGSISILDSFSQTLTVGQDYTVKLQIRNATKKVFIDGVERISSTDNSLTGAGHAGIVFFQETGSDSTGIHLDNFTATTA